MKMTEERDIVRSSIVGDPCPLLCPSSSCPDYQKKTVFNVSMKKLCKCAKKVTAILCKNRHEQIKLVL